MTAKATQSHIKPYAAAMDFKPQPTRASVAAVRMATTACSRGERVISLDYRISRMETIPMVPTTADVGLVLANYMRQTEPAGGDPQVYRDLIGLMLDSPATTPTDALALVSWLAAFLPLAQAMMPEDGDETGGAKALLSNAVHMAIKAKVALELHTGLAAETFIGHDGQTN